jgi:phosphohistidine swiveling domain-containing protein/SAM-dependent methyltransferase
VAPAPPAGAQIWVADTEPNPRLTLYTRGNVGEVFPRVLTALTGTLIGDAVHRGQAEFLVEIGVLRPYELTGPSLATGVFGGYLYMSGSAMRLFGVRMPGMSAADVDAQVLGDVPDLPPYRRAKGDRNLVASLALCRYVVRMLRSPELQQLDEARTAAEDWLATMPQLDSAPDEALLTWLDTFPPRQAASMRRLLQFSSVAGAPRGLLDRFLARPGVPAGLANRIVAGTGDVDSAQLAQRMWAMGRLVAGDPGLSAMFDDGLTDIASRTRDTVLQRAIDAFLADHGHRGNDEYELATPAWVMDPAPVYAAIDRLRRAPPDRDPNATAIRLASDARLALDEALALIPRPLRGMTRRCADVSRQGSIGRERAKDILVLENLGARRVLHELARRAAARGGPADVRLAFCVTADELAGFVARPQEFATLIAERAALQRSLDERVPPAWFDGHISAPATWPLRSEIRPAAPALGTTLSGIAVSGGSASGPARVILDPSDPRGLEPGDVLVCPITDPSWTPLFLAATAVVCDAGAIQSHAAIVARELGIPAVLSVPGITAIPDGTQLHVDGTAGTVHIGPATGPTDDTTARPAPAGNPGRLRRIRFSFESLGLRRAALELLPRHPAYRPAADRTFDDRHGTDTAGSVEPAQLGIEDHGSLEAAILYLPSPLRVTRWMLDRVAMEPTTTTFVDLGCGKGRVVLVAAQHAFRRVIGIELSSDLVATARANVGRYRPPPDLLAPIEIVHADVTTADLPDGDLLVHLYHPFETSVTESFLRRLEPSAPSRRITVAYLAYTEAVPRVRAVFERFGWLREARYEQSVRGHYNWLLYST